MLFVITGQTLTGKTTLMNKLIEKTGIKQIVTYTNRPMREGEVNGVDYHFVSTEEIESNPSYFGKRYFYTEYREEPFIYAMNIDDIMTATAFNDYIVISDPEGLRAIKKEFPRNKVVSVYIDMGKDVLLERAKQRGDSIEEVERRWRVDYDKFSSAKYYADIVLDDKVDDMVEYMEKVIKGDVLV